MGGGGEEREIVCLFLKETCLWEMKTVLNIWTGMMHTSKDQSEKAIRLEEV